MKLPSIAWIFLISSLITDLSCANEVEQVGENELSNSDVGITDDIVVMTETPLIIPEETTMWSEESTIPNEDSTLLEEISSVMTEETSSPEEETTVSTTGIGCFSDGEKYFEGQYIPNAGGICQSCYCLKGTSQCSEIQCIKPPSEGCNPVMEEKKCCPVRYECDKDIQQLSKFDNKEKSLIVSSALTINDPHDFSGTNLQNDIRVDRKGRIDDEETTTQPIDEKMETKVTKPEIQPLPEPEPSSEAEPSSEHKLKAEPESTPEPTIEVQATLNPQSEPEPEPTQVPEPNAEPEPEPEQNSSGDHLKEESTGKPDIQEENINTSNDPGKLFPNENKETVNTGENLDLFQGKTETGPLNTIAEDEAIETVTEPEHFTAPTISISDILFGIDNRNKGTFEGLLPDSITGTNIDDVAAPEAFEEGLADTKPGPETEFPSYDINVGSSIFTGGNQVEPVGVGQVIPVDLRETGPIPKPPTSNPSASSFLNSLMTLFSGATKDLDKEPEVENMPPKEMIPPRFVMGPPPFANMRPPPPPIPFPQTKSDSKQDSNDERNEIETDFDFIAVPSVENEVREEAKIPSIGSATRNELPIRPRPGSIGSRPLRPGLLASRPNLLSQVHTDSHPKLSDDNLEGVRLPIQNSQTQDSKYPVLPSEPDFEDGFFAIRDNDSSVTPIEEESTPDDLSLPPSLPNLQIIPFLAADAVVNHEENDDGTFKLTPRPFGAPSKLGNCREGGNIWQNGQTVARGDDNPCVLCRCLSAKIICQQLQCPNVPEGCTATLTPPEGECCPKLTCDKAANVSIIDTIPSFIQVKEETIQDSTQSLSRPTRPSVFEFKPRNPSNKFEERRPASRPGRPQISNLQQRFNLPPRPTKEEKVKQTEKPEEETPGQPERPVRPLRRPFTAPRLRPSRRPAISEDVEERPVERKPIRPTLHRPKPIRPTTESVVDPTVTTNDLRPKLQRPFSDRTRTGTRRPFIPPRRQSTTRQTDLTTPFDIDVETTTTETSSAESFSLIRPADLPKPIRPVKQPRPSLEEILATKSNSKKPSFLPPGLLLPKPIPSRSPDIDDDIINFVLQDQLPSSQNFPEGLFRPQTTPKPSSTTTRSTTAALPEIPDFIKAQMPMGNDPILALGLIELGGCNVYGRLYDVGKAIPEISAECKECRCTKVGVQCLPIC